MEQWLTGLIAGIPGPLRPAAGVVIGAILRVFQWVDGLFRRVVGGWNPIYVAQDWFRGGLTWFRDEVLATVRWIIVTKIPQWANHALDLAVRWAHDRLVELRNWVEGTAQSILRWTSDRINDIRSFLDSLQRWITDRLKELYDAVRELLRRVFDTWATPLRLAEWLIGALWGVFWRHAYAQRDRIIEFIWRGMLPLLLRFAAEIERQIARLL